MMIFHLLCLFTLLSTSLSSKLNRMYGGQEVSIEQVPFQVAILTNSRFCCGGSLISWNFVLSAAHNFGDSYNPEHYSVKVGTSVLNDGSGLTINVKRIITHHKYTEHKIDYDFALMQLEDVYEFPKVVQFARLPSIFDKLFDGDEVFVSGWGMTETGKSSDVLLGGTAKIFNFEKCYEANAGFLTSRMICAVHENGVTSPCIGKE